MSETKWTKGPWFADSRAICGNGTEIDVDGSTVAMAMNRMNFGRFSEKIGYDESLVNAHLIAAAPELYQALEELVGMNERWNADVREIIGRPPSWTDQYLTTARRALKKARGEQ